MTRPQSNSRRVLPSATEPMARGFIDFIGGPPGHHALIGRQRWWTPLRVLLAVGVVFLSLGWLQKGQCIRTGHSDNGVFADWTGYRQYTSACYSDTVTLFSSRGLDQLHFPYLYSWVDDSGVTRYMEYPVLSGIYQWLVAVIARPVHSAWDLLGLPQVPAVSVYFAVNAFFLAAAWLAAVGLVAKLAGNRVWDTLLMAASPLVIVHAFTNFDLLACLAAVAVLSLWANRRPGWAGVAGGIGVALKLWPAFVVGGIILLCLRARAWSPLARLVAGTVITWLAVNVPILILSPNGWAEFFRLNSSRGWEGSTIYAVIAHITGNDAWSGITPSQAVEGAGTLNLISTIALLICLGALAWFVIFSCSTPPRLAQVAFLATFAFMLTNKVWSPQYSIWLVPLLALALPRWRLVFGWAALETVYWYVRMWQFLPAGQAAPNWLADTLTVARLGLLVIMSVLIIRQAKGVDPDSVRQAHGGIDPLAGVLLAYPSQSWASRRAGAHGGVEKKRLNKQPQGTGRAGAQISMGRNYGGK
ncbi:membrane protein [Corynebacterium falsenii DSM 44353]|uniref:glycosyltransferase family 87 protein n=2 Tax=Corynebacterium falsenii TaxID=108486 RepID=UPI0003E94254|nr:glycosyltransferase 87 family protein [Corynebacterium falsenii]AHI04131.1 membrane protein [Corynebacterium falsenii DSM 44353]UBI04931.1 glycosyltransferase 87 family protein [Corynebacterium falsenii]